MFPSSTSGMKDSGMEENQQDDLRDGQTCVMKMTINDKVEDILFTPISKSLAKLDVLKQ